MLYNEEESEIVFETTGRREFATSDRISVSLDGSVSYGHDGWLNYPAWTPEERIEIATEMISRWGRWAELEQNYAR